MENVSRIEDYKKENEEFYTKLYGDLEEIKSNLNYVVYDILKVPQILIENSSRRNI